ncbi:hypothetical protein Acsp01_42840 [Actinoplanes sp. NBRC 101535]|nr:hypothetical protein Acsp01_42840 [Actinoplanes sp. NBRC 101535]
MGVEWQDMIGHVPGIESVGGPLRPMRPELYAAHPARIHHTATGVVIWGVQRARIHHTATGVVNTGVQGARHHHTHGLRTLTTKRVWRCDRTRRVYCGDGRYPRSPPDGPAGRGLCMNAEDVVRKRRRDYWIPAARLLALLLVPVVILGVGLAEMRRDTGPTFDEMIEAAGLAGKATLTIGVLSDVPGVSEYDKTTGLYSGFDIDVAYMIAVGLGYQRSEVRFMPIESKERVRMQARDGDDLVPVDLVIAGLSNSGDRGKNTGLTIPYLKTTVTLVTRSGRPAVRSLHELPKGQICLTGVSTLAARMNIPVTVRPTWTACVEGVLKGDFAGTLGDAALLAGFVARHHDGLMAHDVGVDTPEEWVVNTGENTALRQLVESVLQSSWADDHDTRWEEAYARHFLPSDRWMSGQQVAVSAQPKDEAEGFRIGELRE